MTRTTRPISWVSAARKDFAEFPEGAQAICLAALTVAAEGGKADIAKPLKGLGSGVMEIALPYRATHSGWSMRCRSARIYGLYTRFRRNRPKESKLRSTRSI
jgi:phage-related protein